MSGRLVLTLSLLASSIGRAQRADSTYQDHIAAARASAPPAAREHLLRALALLHGHPDVFYLLARNATTMGQPEAAVGYLRTIAAMGLAYAADSDSTLAPLRTRADFRVVMTAMAANKSPIGHATTVSTLDDPDLLTEDVAYDPADRTYYLSAIHRRKILAIDQHGVFTTFATTALAPMALVVDAKRHTLWASIAGMAQAEGHEPADTGRSGVLRYDLTTRKLIAHYDLPVDGPQHVLGDMTLDASGNAIVSDGAGGGVYRIDRERGVLSALVPPGTFQSPQNPAVAPDGRIFVADYAMGVATIDPATHAVSWLGHADTVALNGIDGMYLVGHVLYAIQNGTNPERVTRFVLDPDLRRVVTWSVVERATPGLGDPTHAVVVGNDLIFIANSGWDRFGDDGHITNPKGMPARLERTKLE
ncbi:MAG TPA: hypothetical protein VK807_15485 [Gemmatimonadaceae bacterium]|nr:hypothetical protein [Gemmatimonadaceae bacterium]